jgi:hypothetical protein
MIDVKERSASGQGQVKKGSSGSEQREFVLFAPSSSGVTNAQFGGCAWGSLKSQTTR